MKKILILTLLLIDIHADSFSIGSSFSGGNNKSKSFDLNLLTALYNVDYKVHLGYGEQDSEINRREGEISGKYSIGRHSLSISQYTNKQQKIELLSKYKYEYNLDKLFCYSGLAFGVFYSRESITDLSVKENINPTISLVSEYKILEELSISNNFQLSTTFNSGYQYNINNELQIKDKISNSFDLIYSWSYSKNSNPAQGVLPEDYRQIFSLAYTFGE